MKFLEYLIEAESAVRAQLEAIKNGTGEWEQKLKAMITGDEPAFTYSGPRNFQTATPVAIPNDIKKKYPDIIFALQALTKHLGAMSYYDKWEELKKFLTFKPNLQPRTFYRYWPIKEEQLEDLKKGKSIPLPEPKGSSTSYTRNPSLWREVPSFSTFDSKPSKVLSLSTEELLQTHGTLLTLQTKHTFTPIFDVFYFLTHVLNQVKQVFGKTAINYGDYGKSPGMATLRKFAHEREVVGPIIKEIKPSDVVGYYRKGTFNKLSDPEYKIKFRGEYTFLPGDIEHIKDGYKQYGTVDMTYFGNHLIITSDPEKSHLKRYADKPLEYNEQLSKLVGIKLYLGYWP
jgi:hypothetical protein